MGSSGYLYSMFLRRNLQTAEMARHATGLVFHKGEGLRVLRVLWKRNMIGSHCNDPDILRGSTLISH